VCLFAEVGGGAGHTKEQQRQAHQRPTGVNFQCRGMETTATFIQGTGTLTQFLAEHIFNSLMYSTVAFYRC
jgi:hypothetical protein